jgi:hypothetical protein
MNSEYLEFTLEEKLKKTEVYLVSSKSGERLGFIRWFSPWRQYCYFPIEGTLYSKGCMNDISTFINNLMEARRTP